MSSPTDTLARDARRLIDAISGQSTWLRSEVEQLRRSVDAYETGRALGPQVTIEISASIVRDADGDPCVFSANVSDAVNAGMSEVDIISALAGQGAPAALSPIVNGVYEQAQALDQIVHILQHQRFSSDFQDRLDGWAASHAGRIRSAPLQPVRDAVETLREASRALHAAQPQLARRLDAVIVQQPQVPMAGPAPASPDSAVDFVDLARGAGIKIEDDPDQFGMWLWQDGDNRSDVSFPMMEDAAINALESRFKADWESQRARGETTRSFAEFCAWQLEAECEPEGMCP